MKDTVEYEMISNFYRDKRAKRSGALLMDHINDGLKILEVTGATEDAKKAFIVHPIFQDHQSFNFIVLRNSDIHELSSRVVALAVEYRSVANGYLLKKHEANGILKLSPIDEVNQMLIADKVQNYHDFMKYHYGTHAKSKELYSYFHKWFAELGVNYEEVVSKAY